MPLSTDEVRKIATIAAASFLRSLGVCSGAKRYRGKRGARF